MDVCSLATAGTGSKLEGFIKIICVKNFFSVLHKEVLRHSSRKSLRAWHKGEVVLVLLTTI